MGKHLGQLGTRKDTLEVTFGYFDLEGVRVNPGLSEIAVLDFMEAAAGIDLPADGDLKNPTPQMRAAALRALPLVKNFLREVIHPGDFDAVWAAAKRERQDTQDLMQLAMTLIEKVANRPTGRRPGSSGTPRKTGRKSAAGSSSRVIRRLEKAGRPDLALMVTDVDEARRLAASA